MSRNAGSRGAKYNAAWGKEPDARARRTKYALGSAFLELMREKPIRDIGVADVLRRAGVGRSTFYLHFTDKNDLLLSQLEQFLEHVSTFLEQHKETSQRVLPVAEMFDHIGGQNRILHALNESGHIHEFYYLAQTYFARSIERRLSMKPRLRKIPPQELAVRSSMLAGGLLALLRWWIASGAKESPAEIDALFHRIVWTGLQ